MSSTALPLVDEPGDAELIAAVRGGDVAAYGKLYERHVDAARRLARQLASPADADDLVADAFAKVLGILQRGGGPDVAFRAYLLTSVRSLKVDGCRASSRVQPTDDLEAFDPGVPFRDTAVEGFENEAAARAFSSLPERWQLVLWHTEVERQKPAEIAPLLGMSANSVAALAYRAREGLRQAFLTQHGGGTESETCAWAHQTMGAYVRQGTSRRDTAKMEEHLQECRRCTAILVELREVNSNLAGIIAPLLLGGLAAAYVASAAAGSAGLGGALGLLFGRAREAASSHVPAATAIGVAGVAAAGVAVAASVGVLPGVGGGPSAPRSDAPAAASAPASPGQSPGTIGGPTTTPPGVTPGAVLPSLFGLDRAGGTGSGTGNEGGTVSGGPDPYDRPAGGIEGPTAPAATPGTPADADGQDERPAGPGADAPGASPRAEDRTTEPSQAPTPTRRPSPSSAPTPTRTAAPSVTPTPTPTPTRTPVPTPVPTPTPAPTPTPVPLSVSGTVDGTEGVAVVRGLPAGERAVLRISGSSLTSIVHVADSARCRAGLLEVICTVHGDGKDLSVPFTLLQLGSSGSVHLRLDSDEGDAEVSVPWSTSPTPWFD